ncbi:unnamed protein product [Bursaphelenchus xylophilus]|uniref:(pine wood nematode) hypothetical protein n=1 Tax=Bursaphelenchus xylophilus TaxID=6326 RepID=A0A1I7RTJ2_BURXY|nr:unnamed protein product [Bursaphelenchus xylophilus]CAG9122401.1 unnamed protein product [Bursaphelenchus xylophilus]
MKCLILLCIVLAMALAQEEIFKIQTISPSGRSQVNSPFAYGSRPQFRQYGAYNAGAQDSLYQAQNTQYGFANGGGAGGQRPFGGQFQDSQELNGRFNDPQGNQRWNSASTPSSTIVSLIFMFFSALLVGKF